MHEAACKQATWHATPMHLLAAHRTLAPAECLSPEPSPTSMPASTISSGVSKSGSPAAKPITSIPDSRMERARSVSAMVFDGLRDATSGFNVGSTVLPWPVLSLLGLASGVLLACDATATMVLRAPRGMQLGSAERVLHPRVPASGQQLQLELVLGKQGGPPARDAGVPPKIAPLGARGVGLPATAGSPSSDMSSWSPLGAKAGCLAIGTGQPGADGWHYHCCCWHALRELLVEPEFEKGWHRGKGAKLRDTTGYSSPVGAQWSPKEEPVP
jgi:hypothetical protein